MTGDSIAGSSGSEGPIGEPVENEPAAGAKGRLARASPVNMLRSLLPLVVIVLGLAYFCSPQNVDPVTEIDPSSSIRYAASLTEVALPIPELAENWRPTSVAVTAPEDGQPGPMTLTIGYVTSTEEFARYIVSTDPSSQLIEDLLVDADSIGPVSLGGQPWEELRNSRGERLYYGSFGHLRLVVTGSATADELRILAESLRPYRA